ncbi:hypothetical protein [Clostridium pasteurianum]|uniref:DUF4376 domain-containing protein n=1 Tax=Clostridium pasteurianum BC1 TaxID=86416 RepID=R4K142_CLOPA|nr:hypothetical protein [Clostridium pasteurianum]AGK96812.1 hypothetical protein Clopa_1912 [Clostridium pasteurianum BC1]
MENQGKYIVDMTKLPFSGIVQNITDIFKLYVPTLQEVQQTKTIEIRNDYNNAVIAGFTSSASGTAVNYAYDEVSQTKFMKVLMSMSANIITYPATIFAADGSAIEFTQEQLTQLYKDIANFEIPLETKLHTLLSEINSATTADEVNAISW